MDRVPVDRLPLERRALVPVLDPLPDFRPDVVLRREPLVPFRRDACELPRARARAVSRPTSLLKLLRWPPAVFSWYTSARSLSSNDLNHWSQEIGSSLPRPE